MIQKKMREKNIGPNASEIIAELPSGESGEVVGSVIVSLSGDQSAKLGYIGVRKHYRGNGWGDKLFAAASRWAADHGATELTGTLIPVPGCELAMLSLLAKHGATVEEGNFTKKL